MPSTVAWMTLFLKNWSRAHSLLLGKSAVDAVHHAVIIESVARMAYHTIEIAAQVDPISRDS